MVSPAPPPPKWSRRPPQAVAKSSKPGRLLLIAGLVIVLALAASSFLLPSRLQPEKPAPTTAPVAAPVKEESGRLVSLFYPHADGSGLASLIQRRPNCPDEAACLQDLLLALGENPGAGLFPILPPHSDPKSVTIVGPTATINFSRETVQHLPGGVQSERLVLAALVDTLAVNFPQVQQLAIEIDNLPAATLKGHIDLTTPFVADFSLVRRAPLLSPPVKSGTPSDRSQ